MTDYLTDLHDSLVAAAAEIDPRRRIQRWETATAQILEPRLSGLPADIAADIARGAVHELKKQLCAVLENGNYSAVGQAFLDLDLRLLKSVQHERQHGRLKPTTAASEAARCVGAFQEYLWNGFEIDGVVTLMGDGKRIVKVDFDAVYLSDDATITRRNLREKLRPPTIFQSRWDQLFTPEREIDEARAERARREAPQPPSAGPLDENGRPLQGREVFE